jgi:hypothetical protein
MKYIITESRFDQIIMDYLDNQFSGMEKHCDAIGGGYIQWWGNGEYPMIEMGEDNGNLMGFNRKIWDGIGGLFNLTGQESTKYICRWIQINLKYSPNQIYLF